jgi:hypothetical protein
MTGEFELLVSGVVSRARFLETALHSRAPWQAVVYDAESEYHIPATRHIIAGERRIAFVIIPPPGCEHISRAELYCGHSLMTVMQVPGEPSSPCRIVIGIGIGRLEAVS